MLLPNFDYEQHDWILDEGDLLRFEREDIAKTWICPNTGFTFYKLVYVDIRVCEKVVIFDGNFRVGYVTWNDSELCGLYVMPNYRGKGIAKRLLSYVPKDLHVWIQDFKLTKSEPPGLDYDSLHPFYLHHYFKKENLANEKASLASCSDSCP